MVYKDRLALIVFNNGDTISLSKTTVALYDSGRTSREYLIRVNGFIPDWLLRMSWIPRKTVWVIIRHPLTSR